MLHTETTSTPIIHSSPQWRRQEQDLPAPIEKLYWQDVRREVALLQPEMAKIIDEIDPGKDFPLYKAHYPYGAEIVTEGVSHYPLRTGELVTLEDDRLPADMRKDLSYSGTRICSGLILQNSMEIMTSSEKQIIPWQLYEAGAIFALWGYLDADPSYHTARLFNITAGSRFIFSIFPVNNDSGHRNLQRAFRFKIPAPKKLLDQWHVFKTIANQSTSNWRTTMLYFSKGWLDKIRSNDKAWGLLHRFFLEYAWKLTSYWRNQYLYDFAFSCVKINRNLKPNPYLADTAKHLLAMSVGAMPGFGVATDDRAAPINILQNAYTEHYQLKNYAPLFMHAVHFSLTKQQPVYYSLQCPTTAEFSPKSRELVSTLHNLRELKHITNIFINEINSDKSKISNTAVGRTISQIAIDYFHNQLDRDGDILLADHLPAGDPVLSDILSRHKLQKFAKDGAFFRGCVRISKK